MVKSKSFSQIFIILRSMRSETPAPAISLVFFLGNFYYPIFTKQVVSGNYFYCVPPPHVISVHLFCD